MKFGEHMTEQDQSSLWLVSLSTKPPHQGAPQDFGNHMGVFDFL